MAQRSADRDQLTHSFGPSSLLGLSVATATDERYLNARPSAEVNITMLVAQLSSGNVRDGQLTIAV